MGAAGLTRALEALGDALVDMRQAPDPRIPLEVALVRICDPATDAVRRRARRARRATSSAPSPGASPRPGAAPRPNQPLPHDLWRLRPPHRLGAPEVADRRRPRRARAAPACRPAPPAPEPGPRGARAARPRSRRRRAAGAARAAAAPARSAAPAATAAGDLPTVDELTAAMADGVLARLKGVAKAIYTAGRFVEVRDGAAVFALPTRRPATGAERRRADVEAALRPAVRSPTVATFDPGVATTRRVARPATGRAGRSRRGRREGAPAQRRADRSPRGSPPRPSPHRRGAEQRRRRRRRPELDADARRRGRRPGVERLTEAFPGAELRRRGGRLMSDQRDRPDAPSVDLDRGRARRPGRRPSGERRRRAIRSPRSAASTWDRSSAPRRACRRRWPQAQERWPRPRSRAGRGGAVRIAVTGGLEFRSVHIDPEAVDPDDVEMLEDLVLAALHDATAKVHELQAEASTALGGLDLGGLGPVRRRLSGARLRRCRSRS